MPQRGSVRARSRPLRRYAAFPPDLGSAAKEEEDDASFGLNYSDCMSYAVAMLKETALFFKDAGFTRNAEAPACQLTA